MTGSPYLPDFTDAVLIIEDVEETPKSIDRMLHQLRISGIFESIQGLILGNFSGCFPGEEESKSGLYEIVMNATRGYSFPIIAEYPYGHSLRDRLTIPIGAPIKFRTEPFDIAIDL
jgi:muramoyltetrapeptide carboxypeptidase